MDTHRVKCFLGDDVAPQGKVAFPPFHGEAIRSQWYGNQMFFWVNWGIPLGVQEAKATEPVKANNQGNLFVAYLSSASEGRVEPQ